MSVTLYVRDGLAIDVADPGYGYLEVEARPLDDRDQTPDDILLIEGYGLGETLASLTEVALNAEPDQVRHHVAGLWAMTVADARQLLPRFQEAVLYAAAGGERTDRIILDGLAEDPVRPICVHCGEGETGVARNPHPNPWCQEFGHRPFARRDPGPDPWGAAQRAYAELTAALSAMTRIDRRIRRSSN